MIVFIAAFFILDKRAAMDLLFNSVQLDFGKQVIRRENIMKKSKRLIKRCLYK